MRRVTYSDMEFWLEKGIDGYQIDSINLMSKHPDLLDELITDLKMRFQSRAMYFTSVPRMREYIERIGKDVFAYIMKTDT
jgi:oligo-1,6-glucosidase